MLNKSSIYDYAKEISGFPVASANSVAHVYYVAMPLSKLNCVICQIIIVMDGFARVFANFPQNYYLQSN